MTPTHVHSPFSSSSSFFFFFSLFLIIAGAVLCMAPREETVARLAVGLQQSEATHVCSTPAVWQTLDNMGPSDFPHLRTVALGGERIPHSLMRRWAASEHVRFVNTYGVTECTVYQVITISIWGRGGGGGGRGVFLVFANQLILIITLCIPNLWLQTTYEFSRKDGDSPDACRCIGAPFSTVGCHVLDASLQPVTEGELCLRFFSLEEEEEES